jgi:hypothetical protein
MVGWLDVQPLQKLSPLKTISRVADEVRAAGYKLSSVHDGVFDIQKLSKPCKSCFFPIIEFHFLLKRLDRIAV